MSDTLAYHEAGHALMAYLLGGQVRSVTIEPDRDDGPAREGDTQILWRRRGVSDRDYAQAAVQVCLAGPVAEMIYTGEPYHPGFVAEWSADWREAWQLAEQLAPDERRRLKYLEDVSIRLHRQLQADDLWAALASLADHLLAHETLDEEQVIDIIREWVR